MNFFASSTNPKCLRLGLSTALMVYSDVFAIPTNIEPDFDLDAHGHGGPDLIAWAFMVLLWVCAYWYLLTSWSSWKQRRSKGESPEKLASLGDWILPLLGYALVAVFLALPIIFALKAFGEHGAHKQYWKEIYLACLAALAYLRRT